MSKPQTPNMMKSSCILFTFFFFFFFLSLAQASSSSSSSSSSYHQTSNSQFINRFLNSKKGDTVQGLDQVRSFFIKYGYLAPSALPRGENSETLDLTLEEAIKKYQVFYNLDVSGVLDEKTLSLMAQPRCGFRDLVHGNPIKHGMEFNGSHYVVGNTKWPKYHLTWALQPGTRSDAIAPINGAFARWGAVSPFRFQNINDYNGADVKIGFFRGAHGDSSPFDGPGKVLAHATMPTSGRLHFDGDENWVIGAKAGGSDIGTVGLHELGHVLGLAHSNDESAVMWPSIPLGTVKDLTQDDINGLKALYGFR